MCTPPSTQRLFHFSQVLARVKGRFAPPAGALDTAYLPTGRPAHLAFVLSGVGSTLSCASSLTLTKGDGHPGDIIF